MLHKSLEMPEAIPECKEIPVEQKTNTALAAFFDVIKKLIDLSDDAWNAMKGIIPQDIATSVGPYIVGGVGAIVHFREGYEGARLFLEAYRNEQIPQRKTRLLTSALTFMCAGTGVGLSAALIIGAAGLTVAGMVLLPTLISGFLTGIYSLALWRRSYIFDRAKAAEAEAEQEYNHYISHELEADKKQITILNNYIKVLESRKQQYNINEVDQIFNKRQHNDVLSIDEQNKITHYSKMISELESAKVTRANLSVNLEVKQQKYSFFREERLKAEREVAFGTVEVAASALVLVGTIFMTAALVGASIASMGIVPFAILVTGVVLGFVSKLIESQDEKKGYTFSRSIRNWFVDKWKKFTDCISPAPKKAMEKEVSVGIDKSPRSSTTIALKTVYDNPPANAGEIYLDTTSPTSQSSNTPPGRDPLREPLLAHDSLGQISHKNPGNSR